MGNSNSTPIPPGQHLNDTSACEVLQKQNFKLIEGTTLEEKLIPSRESDKFGKIQKKLNCLLGNGRNVTLTISETANELLIRNYPELVEFQGDTLEKKMVIFVPEWYLTKAVKYVEPSRGKQLERYCEEAIAAAECPERKKVFEDMRKFHIGKKTV